MLRCFGRVSRGWISLIGRSSSLRRPTLRIGGNPVKFESELVPGMAPLAWVFTWTSAGERRLLHGSAVRVDEEWFMEGCHDQSEAGDLAAAANVFGSGMCVGEDSVLVVTPSHTLESTYIYRFAGGWSVSNSLALLAAHHDFMPPWDSGYGGSVGSTVLGVDDCTKRLFRTRRGEILRYTYYNIELTLDGRVRQIRKPMPPAFGDYGGYIAYLRTVLGAVFAGSGRAGGYLPLAACSSGYDSACVAALAASLGCEEALTLRTSLDGRDDSGRRVGEILGLRVHEFDRPDSLEESFEEVATFLATGVGWQGIYYVNFGHLLEGRVHTTGFHGGHIWDVNIEPNTVLARNLAAGCYLQEFRLWKNFIHVPVPMIAAVRHPDIAAISRSSEMSAFRIGGNYDRPIPRRILEEAGVPRACFAQAKRHVNQLFHADPTRPGQPARRAFADAVEPAWTFAAAYGPARLAWELRLRVYRYLSSFAARVPGVHRLCRGIVGDVSAFHQRHPLVALSFVAGLSVVAGRYRKFLGTRMPTSRPE